MPGLLANIALSILCYLVVIGVVVTIHELGHFLAGKAVGAKIDQFSIGFGPALVQWTDKAGVEWRIGRLPLGGYVRFAGDDNAASVPDRDDLDALRREIVSREGAQAVAQYHFFKPLWQRALISAAGPLANFLLSITIFAALLFFVGEITSPARVDAIVPGSPAAIAGFQKGDVILEAGGRRVKGFNTIQRQVMLRTGTPIDFVVQRGDKQLSITATPRRGVVTDQLGKTHQMGVLGLQSVARPGDVHVQRYNALEAVRGGVQEVQEVISTTAFYIGRVFAGRENADQISGPIGMAQMSGELTKQVADVSVDGRTLVLNVLLLALSLIANISVGIGFLNLLPIPVLDGGHLLFYAYEAVARRPLAAKVQAAGYRVGLALVLGLMLFATWNDLQRLRVFNFIGRLFS